jgi:hypothetical protein
MEIENQYVNFTPYDQQLAEVQRRQRLADLMQQQAMAPIDVPQTGRLVTPVSPVLGLAKLLQGYMAGKAQRDVAQRQAALGQSDLQNALGMVDRLQAGKPTEVSPQAALDASMGGGTMATPKPTPFSQPEREAMLTRSWLTGGPRTQAIAQMLMKPTQSEAYDVKYEVGPDGKTHAVQYGKTGTKVDLGVATPFEKPTKETPTSLQRRTRSTFDAQGNEYQQDYNFNPVTGEETIVGKPYRGRPKAESVGGKETAEGLRKEFTAQTSQYRSIVDAYQKIEKAAATPTAQNDISLIYGFMRINDPTSTVREGEFATAQNSAGVPEQIRNLYNKIRAGERLSPEQRVGFLNAAYDLVQSQIPNYEALANRYSGIATRSGLLPEDVVFNPFASIKQRESKTPPPPPPGFGK